MTIKSSATVNPFAAKAAGSDAAKALLAANSAPAVESNPGMNCFANASLRATSPAAIALSFPPPNIPSLPLILAVNAEVRPEVNPAFKALILLADFSTSLLPDITFSVKLDIGLLSQLNPLPFPFIAAENSPCLPNAFAKCFKAPFCLSAPI